MHAGAVAGAGAGQLAFVRLRGPDDIRDRLRRMIRIGDEDEREIRQHADEAEVRDRIVGQLLVDGGRHRMPARKHRQRAAVRRRPGNGRGRRGAAGARPGLDHDRLPQAFAQMVRDQPRDQVDVGSGREPVHQGDGAAALGIGGGDRQSGRSAEYGTAGQLRHRRCRLRLHMSRQLTVGWRDVPARVQIPLC